MGDIQASSGQTNSFTNFKIQSFFLNPALSFFPWLDGVAQNYQEYEWNGLVFEFKSLYSEAVSVTAGASGAMGSVIMATNYNSAAPNYANKQQLLEAEYSTDCKPSCSFFHPIECKPSLTPVSRLYTRTGAVPTSQDQRLYDFANFQIASIGCQAVNAVLGELWCTYEVKLYKPIQTFAAGSSILSDHIRLTGCTTSQGFGTAASAVYGAGSTINGVITSGINSTYTFPTTVQQGTYLFVLNYFGSAAAATSGTFSATTGVSFNSFFGGNNSVAQPDFPQSALAGQTANCQQCCFTIGPNLTPGTQVVITYASGGVMLVAPVLGDIYVTQIANITS